MSHAHGVPVPPDGSMAMRSHRSRSAFARWSRRIAGVVVLLAVLVRVGEAQPRPTASRSTVGALLEERAEDAVALHAAVRSIMIWAAVVAAGAFAAIAAMLWGFSHRWIRHGWLQWLLLLVIPVVASVAYIGGATDGIRDRLVDLPAKTLQDIPADPVLGVKAGYADAARRALQLKNADADGHLWRSLALQPGLIAALVACFGLAGVWGWTNKRRMRAA